MDRYSLCPPMTSCGTLAMVLSSGIVGYQGGARSCNFLAAKIVFKTIEDFYFEFSLLLV